MKRLIVISIAFSVFAFMYGQSEFDALKLIEYDINGTARYTSMAGAFGALGGDASAIKDNPAGLGVYRKSDISTTLSIQTQETTSSWRNGNPTSDSFYRSKFNHVSAVFSLPVSKYITSDLKYSNFAISYNRLKNFDRNVTIKGGDGSKSSITYYWSYFSDYFSGYELYRDNNYNPYNDIYMLPWMSVMAANAGLIYESDTINNIWASVLDADETVAPNYSLREKGYLNEFSISWSGNFNDRLFLGASLNIYDLSYSLSSDYSEDFEYSGYLSLSNKFSSTGSGVGLKVGGIYTPADFLRIGASFQTPVVYSIYDYHYADLKYGYDTNSGFIRDKESTPDGDNEFKIQGPFSYNLSGALILGNKAVIGVEFGSSINSSTQFMDLENDTRNFNYENDSINALFTTQNIIKIGGEYKLTDKFALRAGYAISNPSVLSRMGKEFGSFSIRTDVDYFVPNGNTQYYTAGIGYRETNWYFDIAFLNKRYSQKFYPYNYSKLDATRVGEPGKVTTLNYNFIATLGFRF